MKMRGDQHRRFVFYIALSCVTGAAAVVQVSGYEGRDVKVSCSYGKGYESYEKYLCRDDCGDSDVLIETTQAKKNKYSIYDDKNKHVFTTTISDLSLTDAGKYWCGVTRNLKDIYTEVKLEVVPDSCCDHPTKMKRYEEDSVSIVLSYESECRNNLKYICRGNQPSTCLQQALTTSDSKQNGQFTLTDDKVSRKIIVTITSLTRKDSGSYLIGCHRNIGLDIFTAVELEVKEWCCVKSNSLSGTAGRPLTMQCPYPPQHGTNSKFFCKGDHRNNCTDMVMSQNSGQTGVRFTLQDDVSSNSFLVTISELKARDAGTYWCGSDSQWRAANYTKIQLSVDASLFYSVVFIVPTVLLLMLTFALVIVYKYKCYKVQGVGVNMNRNIIKAGDAEEAMGEADVRNQKSNVVLVEMRDCNDLCNPCYKCVEQNNFISEAEYIKFVFRMSLLERLWDHQNQEFIPLIPRMYSANLTAVCLLHTFVFKLDTVGLVGVAEISSKLKGKWTFFPDDGIR
ncbi:polymeric immunoglobulin receptor-like isoform X2 [Xiphias gladius]|uniref:polymeric immunoglobulin receptor-like isoform X2 n=1 Tax=Xiphias gladius TaxID=8245 RepID=UPI001A98A734|nr:polymeric immunoglobulin receptor-like isoform X2 [Xiphias gladius]